MPGFFHRRRIIRISEKLGHESPIDRLVISAIRVVLRKHPNWIFH